MSDFLLLCTDVGLWDTFTKATWGSLDFSPAVPGVCNYANTVDCPLPDWGLGDVEKPWQDMVFVFIVPSLATGCEWVFGLTAMWAHLHQAHLPNLAEAIQKLMLLANKGPNWPYAYVQRNYAMAHMPLSSEDILVLWLMA